MLPKKTLTIEFKSDSPSKAYTLLKKLVAQGILEPVNKGHYAKYRYVGSR